MGQVRHWQGWRGVAGTRGTQLGAVLRATLAELTADARIQSIITGAGCWALCRLECGGHVKYLAVVTGARCDFIGHVLLSPASIFRLSFVIRLTLGLFLLSHHRLLACSAPQPQTTNIWN